MNRVNLILLLWIALCCQLAHAEERLKLDKTTILGNGELPKVTFVVPWRDAPSAIPEMNPSPAMRTRPLATPMDRDVYRRHVEYLRQVERPKGDDGAR